MLIIGIIIKVGPVVYNEFFAVSIRICCTNVSVELLTTVAWSRHVGTKITRRIKSRHLCGNPHYCPDPPPPPSPVPFEFCVPLTCFYGT